MSSKYVQATISPNENEYRDYQNVEQTTVLPQCEVQNVNYAQIRFVNCADEQFYSPCTKQNYDFLKEKNANKLKREQSELSCSCTSKPLLHQHKTRFKSEQDITPINKNFTSLPRLDNSNQCNLDKKRIPNRSQHCKTRQGVGYVCDDNEMLQRQPSLKRIQSPEIINIHQVHNNIVYDGVGDFSECDMKNFIFETDVKCDEYGFRRIPSVKKYNDRYV